MKVQKVTLTLRMPKELNDNFTKYATKRGLAKNALLITLIEDFVQKSYLESNEEKSTITD